MQMNVAVTGREAEVLTPGSFVIERYEYISGRGAPGVQWLVHRVSRAGGLEQLRAFDTRREAAQFIAADQRETGE